MNDFLDKAKDMAEGLKDKVEDMIPDSVKEKLHIGGDADDAESAAVDTADAIPGNTDDDGH